MEMFYEYKADRLKDLRRFTIVNGKMVFKNKNANVEIQKQVNDLRYCDFGIQPIWHIAISFPFGHILKTFRRYDDNDFSKVESYINKKLKKYNFNKIDVQKNSKQINEDLLRISNITTERK